eukprot:1152091-Pelagomonas_calceolata.AAC.6
MPCTTRVDPGAFHVRKTASVSNRADRYEYTKHAKLGPSSSSLLGPASQHKTLTSVTQHGSLGSSEERPNTTGHALTSFGASWQQEQSQQPTLDQLQLYLIWGIMATGAVAAAHFSAHSHAKRAAM